MNPETSDSRASQTIILKDGQTQGYGEWGFEPEEITFDKISLWHGDLDRSLPVSMGRTMAKRIPNVRATFYPNDAHLSIGLNHMDDILEIGDQGPGIGGQ